jgi:hypothetical protein
MALKRAGRGHELGGIDATSKGELMVECPACPHPGRNLPEDWEKAGPLLLVASFIPLSFILIICFDQVSVYPLCCCGRQLQAQRETT